MVLIKNGYLIDPQSNTEGCRDIVISRGRIIKIGKNLWDRLSKKPAKTIHADGLMIAPGLVDVHVHFRDPGFTYKEDILSGAKAAARGGFTSVVMMANTKPAVDNAETLDYVLKKGAETGIHVYGCAAVTKGMCGQELVDMPELYRRGAAGFTDDGIPLLGESLVRRAMERAAELKVPLSFHEEDPAKIINNGINEGEASAFYGIGGSGREAEISLVERDLQLALETGACINIQHISTKEAVELVRRAKENGGNIHAEATPHHFTLTEKALIKQGTLAKMNPPLRTEEDREAIIEGLRDGTIDCIATDHAPHSRAEKEKPLTEAPSGIIGLETALSIGITELVMKGRLTMMELIEKMSYNPARLYDMDAGFLAEGGPADMVIYSQKDSWRVGNFVSKSSNSPFLGETLNGVICYTICGGKIVYDNRRR